jgi:predicted nucleic acid-binding protein
LGTSAVPSRVLADTGPLVAWLVERDQHHEWAVQQFEGLTVGLLTCEAVLTEASLIIHYHNGDPSVIVELVNRGILKVSFSVENESEVLFRLMRRYRSVPMSLADACLVRMSEIFEDSQLLTTDSDFEIYRRFGRRAIPTIMPGKD